MRLIFVMCAAALALSACVTPPGNVRISQTRNTVDHQGYQAFSWGRADVGFDEYEVIAFECTSRGMLTSAAGVVPNAPPQDSITADGGVPDMNILLNNAVGMRESQLRGENAERQVGVDNCLLEFGFIRFGLTAEQIARLETLERGTVERRRYLHSLAADADILRAQGLEEPREPAANGANEG